MFSRRRFLSAGMAMSLGAHAVDDGMRPNEQLSHGRGQEELSLKDSCCWELLGRPRSLADVQEGFHPISPERVVILGPGDRAPRRRWPPDELVDRLRRQIRALAAGSPVSDRYGRQMLEASHGKLGLTVRLMDILTTYYHVPDEVDRWAEALALREYQRPSGSGKQVTLITGFQKTGIPASNPPVDWWLFLFPEGFGDWKAHRRANELPLHAMLAHAFSESPAENSNSLAAVTRLGAVTLAIASTRSVTWADVSSMNRIDAARILNDRVTSTLRNCRAWRRSRRISSGQRQLANKAALSEGATGSPTSWIREVDHYD